MQFWHKECKLSFFSFQNTFVSLPSVLLIQRKILNLFHVLFVYNKTNRNARSILKRFIYIYKTFCITQWRFHSKYHKHDGCVAWQWYKIHLFFRCFWRFVIDFWKCEKQTFIWNSISCIIIFIYKSFTNNRNSDWIADTQKHIDVTYRSKMIWWV